MTRWLNLYDPSLRRKAMNAGACGCAAFWIAVGAFVAWWIS